MVILPRGVKTVLHYTVKRNKYHWLQFSKIQSPKYVKFGTSLLNRGSFVNRTHFIDLYIVLSYFQPVHLHKLRSCPTINQVGILSAQKKYVNCIYNNILYERSKQHSAKISNTKTVKSKWNSHKYSSTNSHGVQLQLKSGPFYNFKWPTSTNNKEISY